MGDGVRWPQYTRARPHDDTGARLALEAIDTLITAELFDAEHQQPRSDRTGDDFVVDSDTAARPPQRPTPERFAL